MKIPGDLVITASFVKSLRMKLGLTQRVFATKLHVALQTVKKWEQSANPVIGTSAVLIYLLEIDPDLYDKYLK